MFLLPHLLSETTGKFPDKEAVVFCGTSITFAELEYRSSQLAFSVVENGIKKGDRVGILLKKSIESIISLFGIMKAGAIYVPIDPLAPSARIKHIILNCGIECLITSAQGILRISSEGETATSLKKAIITGSAAEDPCAPGLHCIPWETAIQGNSPDFYQASITDVYPAYILHTSGSTGIPKGVVISHLNALSFVNMATQFFNIGPSDRMAGHAPLHFDLSVFDIFCAIKNGATLFPVPEYLSAFPVKLAEFIDQEGISIWNSVSSALTMLADKGALDRFHYDHLRLVHFSGDVMPVKYLRILQKHMRNAEFYNIYGQTEANSSLFYKVDGIPENAAWKIPIGKAFPNFEAFGLNDRNEVIENPDEEGELHIKSSTVALGYWGDEENSLAKFVHEPGNSLFRATVYKTGDIVRKDAEGNFLFMGRKDHMIKSRGYRIELSEIELVLNSHHMVRQAIVLAIPDALFGNRIIAYVAAAEGQSVETHCLLDYCSSFLPNYMMPESIGIVDALPLTSTGKIDRKCLEKDEWKAYSPQATG